MTVISIDVDSVGCEWSLKGDVKSKSFPINALMKAGPSRGPMEIASLDPIEAARVYQRLMGDS
jgi:hypothetical protein